ncbi:hypothetical protein COLO4_33381 [Corchorus olitorius]|uniref:Uncharacterized protein n=1 Tax=Corchorus olitorius TaxID=93759 RepID=A0A1R3GUJ2_9ROSI|nr:hypothetical protein COLO4_33381 [Corchorus olitorius]
MAQRRWVGFRVERGTDDIIDPSPLQSDFAVLRALVASSV